MFLIGCHCLAISGLKVARQLDKTTFLPQQHGHPRFPFFLVLSLGLASHSWSEASPHFHQNFFIDPENISYGVNFPFLVGCHCDTRQGYLVAKQFEISIFLLVQYGHFESLALRS